MAAIIIVRGGPAVGKSSVSEILSVSLPKCALIEEDLFNHMQRKRHYQDPKTNKIALELLFNTIDKLLELDTYENIVIEGLMEKRVTMKRIEEYAKQNGFQFIVYQLELDPEVAWQRHKKNPDRKHKRIDEVRFVKLHDDLRKTASKKTHFINVDKRTTQSVVNEIKARIEGHEDDYFNPDYLF